MKENDRNPDLSFEGSSLEFQVLGSRFIEICRDNELDEEGMRIVDEIYKEWMSRLGDLNKKAETAFEKIAEYPSRKAVLESLAQISLEYLEEAPSSPVGKYARKSGDN